MNISLFNDSYPPVIDGVANAVVNYAQNLTDMGDQAQVVTPEVPDADDSASKWPVVRYSSLDTRKQFGYVTGMPFSGTAMKAVKAFEPDILHSHCPISSTLLARSIKEQLDIPLITTYHTKYDIDIANAIKGKLLQESAISALISNINSSDEVWVVSKGAGENLKSLGFPGEYVVMYNGVDMPRGRMNDADVARYTKDQNIPEGVPVFLFVGRLMCYKGLKMLLEALAGIHSQNIDFRMIFIGSGADEEELKTYTQQLGLMQKVIFLGKIVDRQLLSAWYCRADLFLFPSSFDTNGLVVREAAARGLASVLIRDSCASEGVTDRRNGFLCDENPVSLAVLLTQLIANRDLMRTAGYKAANELYFSWTDSVKVARERYQIVLDKYKSGGYSRENKTPNDFFKFMGFLMNLGNKSEAE